MRKHRSFTNRILAYEKDMIRVLDQHPKAKAEEIVIGSTMKHHVAIKEGQQVLGLGRDFKEAWYNARRRLERKGNT